MQCANEASTNLSNVSFSLIIIISSAGTISTRTIAGPCFIKDHVIVKSRLLSALTGATSY